VNQFTCRLIIPTKSASSLKHTLRLAFTIGNNYLTGHPARVAEHVLHRVIVIGVTLVYETMHTLNNVANWYVVHCKPSREAQAAYALRELLGLTVYLPESNRVVRGKARSSPFFSGYLFAQADLEQVNLSSINSTPNVIRLLEFGGRPQMIDAVVVEAIREQLADLNASGGLPTHDFQHGDPVWLTSGPLKGLRAVFVGPSTPSIRVKVLLEFLGRTNEVKVDLDSLEHADRELLPRRRRGSRGKGRRIHYADMTP
jgi:transcriptional antiterminator RfaH